MFFDMRAIIILLGLALMSNAEMWAQNLPEGAVVIGNNIGFESLTQAQVRSVMRGESNRWKGGSDLSVTVVLPSTKLPECVPTSKYLVNSDRPAALQKYWLTLVFEGRAQAPVFGQSQEDMVEAVRNKPGAISIVYGMDVPRDLVIQVAEE